MMSKSSSMKRVMSILKKLNEGKVVNILSLSYEFDVSTRTIRRDLDLIKKEWGEEFLEKNGENYKAIKKNILSEVLNGAELASFYQIITLCNQNGIKLNLKDSLLKKIKEAESIYDLNNKSFEDIEKKEVLFELEKSIKYRQEVKISYKKETGSAIIEYKPYKITLLNENFYLLGSTLDGNFKMLRINLIEKIDIKSKTFYHSYEISDFIKKIQTPFSKFGEIEKKIEIEVSKEVKKYFQMKNFFKSQKILKEKENGNLIVSYEMTQFLEIEDFLIQWMPKIQIIKPVKLKEKIQKKLESKLKSLN